MSNEIRVLGISGSMSANSINTALLRNAAEMLPAGMSLEIYDIKDIPRFDVSVERDGVPAVVTELINKIAKVDALLIATPEYNASITGVLKDTIDWVSRPPLRALNEKPVAVIGASVTALGTARAQAQLRLILQHSNAFVMPKPEVFLNSANEKFDSEGHLTHEPTREQLSLLLQTLNKWTRLVRQER